MEILIKIAQFFLCFTLLVGIHELGHFLMARIFRIRVEKFYILFNPWFSLVRITPETEGQTGTEPQAERKGLFSLRVSRSYRLVVLGANTEPREGEAPRTEKTEYGIGWLPLGGYVKIAGMIDESMDKEFLNREVQLWEFRAKPAWQRFLVMIAGVVMNVVLAIAIYCGICYTWGTSYLANDDVRYGYNFSDAGHALGFHDGDRIVSIDGEGIGNVTEIVNRLIITDGDREVVVDRGGERLTLTLPLDALIAMRQRQGAEPFFAPRIPFLVDSVVYTSAVALRPGDEVVAVDGIEGLDYPGYQEYLKQHAGDTVLLAVRRAGTVVEGLAIPVSEEGRLGVMARAPYTLRTQHYTLLEAIPAGFRKAGEVIASYWEQLKMIVNPRTEMYKELGGFIAIGSIFPGNWNWQGFWLTTAFLSIILAVMNILPIPGLDGGHAIFTFWEMLTGRKVSDRVLEGAQYVGLILILFLLLYANGNDIYRFFLR